MKCDDSIEGFPVGSAPKLISYIWKISMMGENA